MLGLFFALDTQWRKVALVGFGGGAILMTGLDYAAIRPTAELSGITLTPQLFKDLRVMEAAAIKEAAQ